MGSITVLSLIYLFIYLQGCERVDSFPLPSSWVVVNTRQRKSQLFVYLCNIIIKWNNTLAMLIKCVYYSIIILIRCLCVLISPEAIQRMCWSQIPVTLHQQRLCTYANNRYSSLYPSWWPIPSSKESTNHSIEIDIYSRFFTVHPVIHQLLR